MNDKNKTAVKSFTIHRRIIGGSLVFTTIIFSVSFMMWFTSQRENSILTPPLMPWQAIGGCGAGSSGGSSGIKWIGEGVNGALVELEIVPKANFAQTFCFLIAEPRLSFRPRYTTELGLSMAVGMKEMEVQYQSNMDEQLVRNGSRGDLTADIRQLFGDHGQYALQLSLTFPTGQYDAKRGNDKSKNILPQNLQMGRGIYSGTLGLSYTHDYDKGMMLFDAYFNYPFMIRFDKQNQYLSTDYKNYAAITDKTRTRFYYKSWLKPYGESDRGDYYPPSVNLDAIYAYRGVPRIVQSLQFSFSAPLGVRWIHSYDPALYDPQPDPGNRPWDIVLGYGAEFSRDNLPIFLAAGLPIHAKTNISGKWERPDWENIGQEWIIALGLKVGMF
jgi:hypothetical protein